MWAVRIHKLNEQDRRQGARRCGGHEICIERTAFPVFVGDQENWTDYRRLFKKMIKISNKALVLELAQLRRKLPEAARKLLTVVQELAAGQMIRGISVIHGLQRHREAS